MPSQRRKTLNRVRDFDANFEDDELNWKKEKTRKFKENEKEKEDFSNTPYKAIFSSYDETIKKLGSTNFGIFIKKSR